MSVETAWPNWIDRPILIRLYDLINGVEVSLEHHKQTLIDAANEISDLVNEANALDDDDDDCCLECGRYSSGELLCDACSDEQAADAAKEQA